MSNAHTNEEQLAKERVANWVRSTPRGFTNLYMREQVGTGLCLVVEDNHMLACGNTWADVLVDLRDSGIEVAICAAKKTQSKRYATWSPISTAVTRPSTRATMVCS